MESSLYVKQNGVPKSMVKKRATRRNPLLAWRMDQKPQWTQRDVAGVIGVTVTAVHNWESGKNVPKWPHFVELGDLVSENVGELLDRWIAWRKRLSL